MHLSMKGCWNAAFTLVHMIIGVPVEYDFTSKIHHEMEGEGTGIRYIAQYTWISPVLKVVYTISK